MLLQCLCREVGDCVLMRASDSDNQPYVARVEKMEADGRGSVRVRVRWYYRPEESKGGRRQFHGAKELFLSDHFDLQSAHTIEGKCVVHSFKNYTKLDNVGPEDFFCRFEYKAATGSFTPDRVAVYGTPQSFSLLTVPFLCMHFEPSCDNLGVCIFSQGIANVRCHTTPMTSWCSATLAKTGTFVSMICNLYFTDIAFVPSILCLYKAIVLNLRILSLVASLPSCHSC
jgi:energy-converting hydrogenase Eha subunit C